MKYSLLLFLFAFRLSATSQVLPTLSAETADRKHVAIPNDLIGKYSLLCFATSSKAQKDLETWMDPVYQKFIAKTGLMDDMFDVNIFFIPILKGIQTTMLQSFKRKVREAQADLQPHILFVSGSGDQLVTSLHMTQSDISYLFLLDKEGKIIYKTTGPYTEKKWDDLDDLIE